MSEEKAISKDSRGARQICILWGLGFGALLILALLCAVVVPVQQTRKAVARCQTCRNTADKQGVAQEIEQLGGDRAAVRRFAQYLRLPKRLAPYRFAATWAMGNCGESAVPELTKLLNDADAEVRRGAREALDHLERGKTPCRDLP